MHKKLVSAIAALVTLACANAFAEDLATYVGSCRTEVGFTNAELPASINCYDGYLFAGPNDVPGEPDTSDYVVYRRVNEKVDLAMACRWLFGSKTAPQLAASIEMQVHNRENGNTCFFSAKKQPVPPGQDGTHAVPPSIVLPTASNGSTYWHAPDEINGQVTQCVNCHAAGPYIASPRIGATLARYGLLNNGHDTTGYKFRAVGQTFAQWNPIIQGYLNKTDCSGSCHALSTSTVSDVKIGFGVLLPSINTVIGKIIDAGLMAPSPPESDYLWINGDNPTKSDDVGDAELFANHKAEFPGIMRNCETPTVIDARMEGSFDWFTTGTFPDKLATFNLRDGLRCVNTDQADGTCNDYSVSYLCNGGWIGPTSIDTPAGTGDDERRPANQACSNPTAMLAFTTVGGVQRYSYAPADRLSQWSADGLVCRNADQGAGQRCSNYIVRYRSCNSTIQTFNLSSSFGGRRLTATSTSNDAETRAQPDNPTWNSQDWVIERTGSGTTVRLRNIYSGKYLNVRSQAEDARITTYDFVDGWTSMQWYAEHAAGTNDVRFRNVWSGKYLTVVDQSDYSVILAKTLNTTWPSQRWSIVK